MGRAVLCLLAMSLILTGCKGGPGHSDRERSAECPPGSGVTAQDRLAQIEKMVPGTKVSKLAAERKNRALRPEDAKHVARAFAAARASVGVAKAKQEKLLDRAEDSLELIPLSLEQWPDVRGVIYPDMLMGALLDDIIDWAGTTEPTARQLALACKTTHYGITPEHKLHVEFAWEAARDANAVTDPLMGDVRDALWLLCVSELTHGPGGGAPAK